MKNRKKSIRRCLWCGHDPIYVKYHDSEWGVPVYDDKKLFEFLILEGAQAGLSWITILKRRTGYRKAFANFNVKKVAQFNKKRIEKIMKDPGVIRNRLKIESAVTNAKAFIQVQKEFGSFSNYQWQFVGGKPLVNKFRLGKKFIATSPESDAFSLDLKKRGFRFVGSTIMYAHMQAVGMVNDHVIECFRYKQIKSLYRKKPIRKTSRVDQ